MRTDKLAEVSMPLNVNLTPQLEAMVREKVASGLYGSASEVVREALRLMEAQDRLRAARLEQLRQDIREGLDSGPAGELDVDAIKQRGRARLKKTQTR
jgi:antitoxin ParD1/3/4